jgi:YfiH family protein
MAVDALNATMLLRDQGHNVMPVSWLRPNWDFAFAMHRAQECAQAKRLAQRYFVLCSNRLGGVSDGVFSSMNLGLGQGDDHQHVMENRERLAQHLPAPPRYMRLNHGARCVRADAIDTALGLPEADAAVLTEPGQTLVMLTGDCVPIVLADTAGQALGLIHAGWRGLALGVIESAVTVMRERAGESATLLAWIGPCIGAAAFEVGEDVLLAFPAEQRMDRFFRRRPADKAEQRWMGDLIALASHRLRLAGISAIAGGLWCTWHDKARYFSHRRQAGGGRFATAIALLR